MNNNYRNGYLALGVLLLATTIVGVVDRPEFDQTPAPLCGKAKKIAHFFIRKGVQDPVNKAVVIAENSKYPKLAAAQAVVESKVNPAARGKAKEKGAFQVIEAHWGKVADQLDLQTQQHSNILDDLLEEKQGLYPSVKAYNGKGPKADAYARLVLRNMREVGL